MWPNHSCIVFLAGTDNDDVDLDPREEDGGCSANADNQMPPSLELALSKDYAIDWIVHPEDSISDVKRQLQPLFKVEWGLMGRKVDRDKIRTGWEIVCKDARTQRSNKAKDDNGDDTKAKCGDADDGHHDDLLVMSYHLFLHSYDIQQ